MSKVFNMVGGGGGKNISSIVITGLSSTDTVTCTKDGKSYTATWDSTAQHWEIGGLPLGTFTITATNGTKTTTETVLIDIAGVYEIEMSFKLWLYRDGDQCEEVTGGWEIKQYGTSNGSLTLNDTSMKLYGGTSQSTPIGLKNTSLINIGDYSKICVDIDYSTSGSTDNFTFGITKSYTFGSSGIDDQFEKINQYQPGNQSGSITLECNITGATNRFITIYCYKLTAYIKRVWLE